MTYIDLKCKSMSTKHLLKLCLVIGNLHTKLEDPSAIITQDLRHNAKLGKLPIETLKLGIGVIGLGLGTFVQNLKTLASLLPEILCIIQNKVNEP
jgi:hypothetical protein